ncbi:MAG: hypothetical protein M3142_00590, partial [Bacteroidota bacterium]|nr:hypothetical protein [Bacteroidota bacterium]
KLTEPLSVTCKLTTPELQQRKRTVIADLNQNLLEKKELANGFVYRFEATDNMIDLISSFVKTERLCCDFFNFTITVSNDNSLWLNISGPEGAKDFITTELEL